MELTIDEIKKYLPHRDPFLFVDKVTDLNICKDIYGEITFNENLFFFKGHFPNRPIVPGVIIVESLAQLGGLLIYKSFEDELIGKETPAQRLRSRNDYNASASTVRAQL